MIYTCIDKKTTINFKTYNIMEILNLLLSIIFAVAIEVAGLFLLFGVLLRDQPEMK